MRIVIFEDNKELADSLKEFLEMDQFEVMTCYNLKDTAWRSCDIVLGDFRNQIVSFEDLRKECNQLGIPLMAISGAATGYRPELIKPFTTDELKSAMFKTLVRAKELGITRKDQESEPLFGKVPFWKKSS